MRMMLALAVLVLCACKSKPELTADADTRQEPVMISTPTRAPSSDGVLAVLERGACFGRCPVYKATVREDGTVIFEGQRFVKQAGMQEGRLDAAQRDALIRAFERTDFAKWKTQYVQRTVTDLPTVSVTFRGKTIRHYLGDESAPAELTTLEDALPTLMNLDPFITGDGAPTE